MAVEPNATEIANGTATISIAGKQWPIPLLAFRQNKMIVPILIRLGKPNVLTEITEATMNDLGTMVFIALSRAHPTLTRDEFENWPIRSFELIGALDVIATQTGILVRGEAGQSVSTATPSTLIT